MYTIHVEFGVCKIVLFEMSLMLTKAFILWKNSNLFDQMYSKNTNIVKYYNSKLFFWTTKWNEDKVMIHVFFAYVILDISAALD